MAIYLDACVFPADGNLQRADFQMLFALAASKGRKPLITSIVAEEVVARIVREYKERLQTVEKALDEFHEITSFGIGGLRVYDDRYDPSDIEEACRRQLHDRFEVVETAGDVAIEALRREVWRVKPAKSGKTSGGRDCAIWLASKNHHFSTGEEGWFVSTNTGDFADADDNSKFHTTLLGDLVDASHQLHFARSLSELLPLIGPKVEWDKCLLDAEEFFDEAWKASRLSPGFLNLFSRAAAEAYHVASTDYVQVNERKFEVSEMPKAHQIDDVVFVDCPIDTTQQVQMVGKSQTCDVEVRIRLRTLSEWDEASKKLKGVSTYALVDNTSAADIAAIQNKWLNETV